jgi:hypothetical protein
LKRLGIIPLDQIKPHEETSPSLVDSLKDEIEEDGFQRDPVIVDSKTGTALDGMHRLAALREIGAHSAVILKVSYARPEVKVTSWLRLLADVDEDSPLVRDLASSLGYSSATDSKIAVAGVNDGVLDGAVITRNHGFLCSPRGSLQSLIQDFDSFSDSGHFSVFIGSPSDCFAYIEKFGGVLLYLRSPKKYEVVEAAASGNLFPKKSTRHIIPFRVLNVRYPLTQMKGERRESARALGKALKDHCRKLSFNVLQGGSVVGKRKYEENVVLFSS